MPSNYRLTIAMLAAGLVAWTAPAQSVGAEPAPKPNFIVVFADDLGYGDLGCFGAEGYSTPNLDRMADQGRRFTDFYVPAPVCTPSRCGLLTGCHPVRLGLGRRVLFPYSTTGLNPDEITIAEILKTKGYATACVGKWHLGHHAKFLPTRQGFDRYFGIPYSNDMGSHPYKQGKSPPLPLLRGEVRVEQNPDQRFLTKRYIEEAIAFLRANRDRPFFLYLPHAMPHRPIAASPKFKGKTEHGLYGDVIEEIDWGMGRLFATLAELGIDEKTLVIFTSDNGPVVAPESRLGYRSGSARPLRGRKNTTWEGGMRVPCVVRWPNRIPAGTTCDQLASVMDLLPTLAKLAGAEPPSDRIIDGRDIWPLMAGAPNSVSPHEAFFFYRDERLQAVRSGKWKLHVFRPDREGGKATTLLYDLRADVGETTDVAADHPQVVARLRGLAERARADLGDAATGCKGVNVRPVGAL